MEIATAFVAVRPVSTNFGSQLNAQLEPQLAATEGRLARLFSPATLSAAKGFAGGLLASMGLEAIDRLAGAHSNLNEEVSKTQLIFGDAADEVVDWSSTSASALQLSQRAALGAVGTFGDFFDTLGLGDEVGATLGQRMVELATDVASLKNVQAGAEDVASRFFRALTGERESLKELGIVITELDVANKAAELGFERQAGQFSQGAKALATYELILERTANAQGDAARTGDEFAGQSRQLDANLEDLAASIGGLLVPALRDLKASVNSVAGPLADVINTVATADLGGVGLLDVFRHTSLVLGPVTAAGAAVDFLADQFGDADDEALNVAGSTSTLADVLGGNLTASALAAAAGMDISAEAAEQFRSEVDEIASAFFGSIDAEEAYGEALRDVEAAQLGVTASQRALSDAREGEQDAVEALNDAVREQAEAQDQAALAADRAARAVTSAERAARRAQRTLDEAREDQAGLARDAALAAADFGPDSRRAHEAAEELEDVNARVEDAEFAVEEAHLRVEDAARAQRDAQAELTSALNGTNDASDRVRDAQDRVEAAHRRVGDAANAVETAERRVGEATDNAARAAIDAEVALRDQAAALEAMPDAGAGFLTFLDEVATKRPEVAGTLNEWRTELEGINAALGGGQPLGDGVLGGILAQLSLLPGFGAAPGLDLSPLFPHLDTSGIFPPSPFDNGKAVIGTKERAPVVIAEGAVQVYGSPDMWARAQMRDTVVDLADDLAARDDAANGVRS